ncbi:MAG TPA: SRPBCC domain-containing protein [Solirubrobacteraceae bacterium]|nr:SRPBCC domain-containing protein [Solirubrobacteraceae bacterium]
MATNERFMPVPATAVWDALADAGGFGYWVVGSKTIRDADPEWPAPGSRFHHTIGTGPLESSDHTESLEADPPRLLRMRAKARPLGIARVTLEMTPKDGGTVVRMTENLDGIYAILNLNPLVHVLTKLRNAESLMRLEELALERVA